MKRNIIYIFYIFLVFLVLIFISPYFIYLILRGRGREVRERLGLISFPEKDKLLRSQVIWLHGASVGEIKAAGKVLQELKNRGTDNYYFIVTVMTPSGRKIARSDVEDADCVSYMPVDFAPILYFFVRRLQPDMLLLLETELWPALIQEISRRGGRIAVFNGRISDSSFSRYKKIKFLLSPFLHLISHFYMQNEKDCQRIKELDVPAEKVDIGGNIKYSGALEDAESAEDLLNIKGERIVLAAGSTHYPEEEELLDIYCNLKQKYQQSQKVLLILAPRYVDRRDEIIELIADRNLSWQQRSQEELTIEADTEVFLLDTIGELMSAYKVSDLAFVGGTLAEIGGHNFLEPLACSSPVILGPHTEEIESELRDFRETDFIHQISDKSELAELLEKLLADRLSDRSADFSGQLDQNNALNLLEEKAERIKKQINDLFSLLPLGRDAKKVLFIRLSALGDVIHTLPAFSLLARNRPQYELHWLVEPLAAPLVEHNKYVDEARILPRHDWRGEKRLRGLERWKSVKNYLSGLAAEDYELSLDLHGILKSALPSYFARAEISYGPDDPGEGSGLFYDRYLKKPGSANEIGHRIEKNMELIFSGLGCETPENREKLDYGLKLPDNWRENLPESLREFLQSAGEEKHNIIGIIHPLSSWPSKNWVMERYRLLAGRLLSAGINIIISGGPDERSRLQQVFSAVSEERGPDKIFNAAGRLDLIDLYGVLTEVDFFLGADTGPMHLAAAADTAVAAIMGPTLPERYGPYCEDNLVLRNEELDCLGCGEKKCPLGHHNCMQKLSVEEVEDKLKGLLPKNFQYHEREKNNSRMFSRESDK